MACLRRVLLLLRKAETTKRWTAWDWGKTLSFPSCWALPAFLCGWDRVHRCVNEMFPFIALLEILVRNCGIFVYPLHPLFLGAQHRGFLALPMQFFKSATSSATYIGSNLLEGVLAIAWPYSVRGRAVCWPCGMCACQHHGQFGFFLCQQHGLALSECISLSAPPVCPPCPSHSTKRRVKCQTQH